MQIIVGETLCRFFLVTGRQDSGHFVQSSWCTEFFPKITNDDRFLSFLFPKIMTVLWPILYTPWHRTMTTSAILDSQVQPLPPYFASGNIHQSNRSSDVENARNATVKLNHFIRARQRRRSDTKDEPRTQTTTVCEPDFRRRPFSMKLALA